MANEIEADANTPLLQRKPSNSIKESINEEHTAIDMPKEVQSVYKPKLISIGPYNRGCGSKDNIKQVFRKLFFGKNFMLYDQCTKTLNNSKRNARFWYNENIRTLKNDERFDDDFIEMLLLDGCFILEFFYQLYSIGTRRGPSDTDAEVRKAITAFINVDGNVVKTLTDLLLFENQIPFFVLFELHKLKYRYRGSDGDNDSDAMLKNIVTSGEVYYGSDGLKKELKKLVDKYKAADMIKNVVANIEIFQKEMKPEHIAASQMRRPEPTMESLEDDEDENMLDRLKKLEKYRNGKVVRDLEELVVLQELIVLVKKCYVYHVPKLTPMNVTLSLTQRLERQGRKLPKHVLEVVHSLCIPHNAKTSVGSGRIHQINTATGLQKDGISFETIGEVYAGFNDNKDDGNYNANDSMTLFDVDFNCTVMKIPCFKIEDGTETFLRSMIAYEQHGYDPNALKYFTDFVWLMGQLIESSEDVTLLCRRGIIVNLLPNDDNVRNMFDHLCDGVVLSTTFSRVIHKVNRFGHNPLYVSMGKLRQDLCYSPWKLISSIVGLVVFVLGAAVTIKNLLK